MNTIAQHAAAARNFSASRNEGGAGFNPHWAAHDAAVQAAFVDHISALVPQVEALRAAWNAAVAKYATKGQVNAKDLPKIEKEAGISMTTLKLVIAAAK